MKYKVLALLMMAFWPQVSVIPEFFFPPDLKPRGPEVRVEVIAEPFEVTVDGEATVERIDGHRIRLTTKRKNIAIRLESGESIYGLTQRIVAGRQDSETAPKEVGGLDRRGEVVNMWVLPSEAGYAPFYHSSRGYGMFVEGASPGMYDIGKTEPDVLRVGWEPGPEGFSCVFLHGPSYLEILDRYTAMTGRPILPPRWVYEPWKWRDEHRAGVFDTLDGVTVNADVAEDIKYYERLGFPVGVYLIDRPWAPGTYGYGGFEWDANRFPNGDRMVQLLKARGWRVIMWGAPWALGVKRGEDGYEARNLGYIMGDRNLDYTNPAAVAWHRARLEAWMRRTGIDGWKLDRGDEYTPSHADDIWHDGRNGLQVHNDYIRLYVKTFYDAARAVRGDDFVLKSRPAYTGTTAWSITYGGDTPGALYGGRVGTDLGLRGVIISLQRMAFMGYPTWGSDTGGYEGFTERDVFARWLEFSCFCPLMEIGGVGEHEPWKMPTEPAYDEEMIGIYRQYTTLHARLADYTYALARRAHDTGNPIVHPLVMDWPDDPKVRDRWDEFMYGPALLVAPVWRRGERSRTVYLPAGRWVDFWDRSRTFAGPVQLEADAPLGRIPVYVRAELADQVPLP